MGEFQYKIITPEGKEKKGTMEAKSAEQATMILKKSKEYCAQCAGSQSDDQRY